VSCLRSSLSADLHHITHNSWLYWQRLGVLLLEPPRPLSKKSNTQSQGTILRLRILHLRLVQLLIISLDSIIIQMAIYTHSKAFLATPVVQKLVNDIYSGNVVFSLPSTRSILADNYKPCPIQMYDVHKAPFLNHYRYADCSSRFLWYSTYHPNQTSCSTLWSNIWIPELCYSPDHFYPMCSK